MKHYLGVECGQRWWRPRSWRGPGLFRKLSGGFAFGPIMFAKKEAAR